VLRLLIGMPDADWETVLAMQPDFLMIFSPFPLDAAAQTRLDEVAQFYLDYVERLLDAPGESPELVRRLLAAEASGELSRVEVLSLMHTVLDAGFETTRTSISNAVELFARDPELLDRVRGDAALVTGMVEETLRLRAPVQAQTRILTEDHTACDGTVVPAGARTLCLIGSANTDERVFPDPHRVDLRRPNAAKHLSFGGGLHHCLGAPLARVQLEETVAGLARRYSRIELDGGASRYPSLIFPSLSALPVRVRS
jgi:cytochrome P450